MRNRFQRDVMEADLALGDDVGRDWQNMWHGKGRDENWYSIDELPDGGFIVYRHTRVAHVGMFDTFEDARHAVDSPPLRRRR